MDSSGPKRVRSSETPMGEKRKAIRVWMLGGFRVSVDSTTIPQDAWRLRKAAALVKLLALAPGYRMHREQAMDLLWPDSGKRAASNSLRKALHVARGTLDLAAGSRVLASEDESLVLCPRGDLWVDVEAFEEAATTARRAQDPAACRAAVELYTGDLLPEDRYEEWAESRREELRRLYLSLLVELAELYAERGEHKRGIEVLKSAVTEVPTLEEAHAGLMRLHALSGQRRDALQQYETLRDVLSRELAAEPDAATRRLREDIAAGRFPPVQPVGSPQGDLPDAGIHNLPHPRTSFVGRAREMVEIKRGLAMTRLLTLTGAGGSGKTRLALEVARDLVGAYPDGVWLVELAALTEGELVPQAVAGALRVQEQPGQLLAQTLAEALRSKKILLLLDNCEHLVGATADLVDVLLDFCSHLRILATSREALDMTGEVKWTVPVLSVPEPHLPPAVRELEGAESVQLFVERARRRDPAFELTPQNATAVAEVCTKLEGMPLAIELAAARMDVLTVEQIAQRLDRALGLLSGGRMADRRHRTLRATLDWSIELLSEPERKLFCRLSVFAGGWTLEAAEVVGAGEGIEEGDVVELFLRLVDKSLVVSEAEEGGFRYGMLEPVRQYAIEKLEEGGENDAARRRHAEFFLSLAERAYPELRGPGQVEWLHRLMLENDNLRAAIAWFLSKGDASGAVRLGSALWPFWYFRGQHREGRTVLEAALDSESILPLTLRIRASVAVGIMAYGQADLEATGRYAEWMLELSRVAGGDAYAEGFGRAGRGLIAMNRQNYEEASAQLERAVTLLIESGEAHIAAQMRILLGTVALLQGDHARAESGFEEGLTMARQVGDRAGIYNALFSLAQLALIRGDNEEARSRFGEGMALSRQMEDRANVAYCLEGMAAVAGMQGRAERSVRLFGAAEKLLESVGGRAMILDNVVARSIYEHTIGELRVLLSEGAFEEAWADGRAMILDNVIEYALSAQEEAAPPKSPGSKQPSAEEPAYVLTRREEEIVTLVAQGLTNRQIASDLSISEHTAATHVRRILKKLGLRSRVELAGWVSSSRPPLT
jgi:predicted ATPase/DNA-binding SARP family transcriptional activator/DNA-binding CsgD family transcriptional regulator